MPVTAVTGSASGIGAACVARLRAEGHRVIGVDRHRAEINCDLETPAGRAEAVAAIAAAGDGQALSGLVTCAGLAGGSATPGSRLASVNYFGTVELLEGLRPQLAATAGAGASSAAVAVSSNATTVQPAIPLALTEACLDGDEERARGLADEVGSLAAYPATKLAVARFVRRQAVRRTWAGAGVRLNAVAPGVTATPMVAGLQADPGVGPLLDLLPVPLGRPARPEEIAAVIGLLLGPEGGFFCGSVLFCDGGSDALLRTDDWPAPLSGGWPPRSTD